MQLTEIPEGPTNVRVLRDGRELPVDIVYSGRRGDGTAVFTVVNAAFLPGDRLLFGTLPPMTAVVVASPKRPR
ncbi:hypothetical protein [Rhodococcus rhodochrous]|uniref:hypothetical protein n=1 Tax=Rhodococcus rhodochrous TaxID=1829 RepID=UPI001782D201|nr:hypothetical protein [Rhodococcus rhodochrous]QOH59861.1 hypothetical protein C6Y44_27605 [Rhodococcus rhodochrous]